MLNLLTFLSCLLQLFFETAKATASKFLVIRYEDLTKDTFHVLRELLSFSGLESVGGKWKAGLM
jgi:hypothetical protein